MARAAVKAKQKQAGQAVKAGSAKRPRGRRGHAAGGNPNQQLFFMRLRQHAKWVYVLLAVLFAVTFAFLGVGSGSNSGLDQLFQNLNIFSHHGSSVSKAQDYIKDHPNAAKGYRDLATAYEGKGETDGAITALQSYTRIKTKDVRAWTELGGLQLTQAGTLAQQFQNAYVAGQLAAPSTPFRPTGKFAEALPQSPIEQAASQQANTSVSDLQQRTQLAYNNAVSSFDQATQIQPGNANLWLELGQAGQSAGDPKSAVKGYKRYLKLSPDSTSAAQIKELIKQLSASTSG